MITDIEYYFTKGCGRCDRFDRPDCSAALWRDGLLELRSICQSAGLDEVVKWGQPTYVRNGRNIAIFGAFRNDFRLTFFNGSLMKDPHGILEKQGANAKQSDMIRFTDVAQVAARKDIILAYLTEAISYADAGIKPVKVVEELDLPEELISALDADPELAEAFHALTPGRQKSYVINLNGAKQSATRIARITKFRDKIISGKGAMER